MTPLAHRDRGATSIEYGIMVAGIAAVIAVVAFSLGIGVLGLFQTTLDAIEANF